MRPWPVDHTCMERQWHVRAINCRNIAEEQEKRTNLESDLSPCTPQTLSIFRQEQCASHTNQYQRIGHQKHAKFHQLAWPAA